MASVFHCQIVSMEHSLYDGEAHFVSVPAAPGDMGFYAKHAPVLTTLGSGIIKVIPEAGADAIKFVVRGGFVENDGDTVTILANYSENLADLDPETLTSKIAALEVKLAGIDEGFTSRVKLTKEDIEWNKKLLALVQEQQG